MFKTCWNEYKLWLKSQWKTAWVALRDAVITFLSALYTWIYSVLGSIFVGFWKLVLKPIIEYSHKKLIEWISKI